MTAAARKYLIFQLADKRFAFDLAQVAEVEELPQTWPIPKVPRCYTGAMSFHGTIIAVMDLARFFGFDSKGRIDKTIVLDTRIASLALQVEKVLRIAAVEPSDVREGAEEDFVTGYLNLPDGKAILLDAAAIAERAAETING